MKRIAIRVVLVAMALTTIATSQAPPHEISASKTVLVQAPEVVHVTVVANAIAADHADDFVLELYTDREALRIVPDNPELETSVAVAGGVAYYFESVAIACQPTGPCEVGFSLELVDDAGETLDIGTSEIDLDARLERERDDSFFLPTDRSFPDDATLEIRIDGI